MTTVTSARARLGAAARYGSPNDVASARRDLAAEKIHAYIERTVAAAPPLSDDQRARLAGLLGVVA